MKKHSKTYSKFQLGSAIFMIVALLWLTISVPFVYAGQQEVAKQGNTKSQTSPLAGTEEESSKPIGNNSSEEKHSNSSTSISEEYLHDHHEENYFASSASQFHKSENVDAYVAYHGELLVPPPNVA